VHRTGTQSHAHHNGVRVVLLYTEGCNVHTVRKVGGAMWENRKKGTGIAVTVEILVLESYTTTPRLLPPYNAPGRAPAMAVLAALTAAESSSPARTITMRREVPLSADASAAGGGSSGVRCWRAAHPAPQAQQSADFVPRRRRQRRRRQIMKATDSRPNANAAANMSGVYDDDDAAAAAMAADGVALAVTLPVGVCDGVPEAVGECEPVGVAVLGLEGVYVGVPEAVGECVGVPEPVGECVWEPVGVYVGVPEPVGVYVAVGENDDVPDPVGEYVDVPEPVGETVEVAVPVGEGECEAVEDCVGVSDGVTVTVGVADGQPARQLLGGLPVSSMLLCASSGCCAGVKAAQWIKVRSGLPPMYSAVRYAAPSKSCCWMAVRLLEVRSSVVRPGIANRPEADSCDRLPA